METLRVSLKFVVVYFYICDIMFLIAVTEKSKQVPWPQRSVGWCETLEGIAEFRF